LDLVVHEVPEPPDFRSLVSRVDLQVQQVLLTQLDLADLKHQQVLADPLLQEFPVYQGYHLLH